MKRSLRVIGLAALVALPVMASAQEARPVSFGVSGGLSLPVGDLGDGVDAGYNITGHVAYKPASFTNLSFRGDVSFDRWGVKSNNDANFRALGVSANAVYSFPQTTPGVVRPYVLGGVGFYNSKASVSSGNSSVDVGSDSNLGVQAGAGINFQLSGFSTFVEAKFVNVFTEGNSSTWIPITFGFKF